MKKLIKISTLLLCLVGLGITFSRTHLTGHASENYLVYMPFVAEDIPTWIGPDGGSIVALAIDPLNPNIQYAGTWGAGVYKSIDGGDSWQAANQGLTNSYINSMAINPQHPETVFAGTYKNGVYRSTDSGQSWWPVNSGIQDQAIVYSLVVHPTKNDLVFAATRGISNNGSSPWNGVLYRSQDGGMNWSPVLSNVPSKDQQDWVYSIDVDKIYLDTIFAATHEHGVYRSRDYGISWEQASNGLNDYSTRAVASDYQQDMVYSGFWHTGGVYISKNHGDQWTIANPAIAGVKSYSLTVDPNNSQTAYLGTFNVGMLKTTDSFQHYSSVGPWGDKFYTISINPKNSQLVYSGTLGDGIWASKDGGTSWAPSSRGIKNTSVVSIQFNGDQVYAGIFGGGVQTMPVTATTWSESNLNLPERFLNRLVQDPTHPNLMYALTDSSGLYKKDMNSSTGWTNISTNLPPVPTNAPLHLSSRTTIEPELPGLAEMADAWPGSTNSIPFDSLYALAIAPSNPNSMYLGLECYGVYKSTNGGADWKVSELTDRAISSLVVDPRDDRKVFAAGSGSNIIFASADGGQNWAQISAPDNINTVALSPTQPDLLFAGTATGLYRKNLSTNEDWAFLGLYPDSILSFAFDPDRPDHILVGTNQGVYQSWDGGGTWAASPQELQGISVQAIAFDPNDPTGVYFGTQTRGILHLHIR